MRRIAVAVTEREMDGPGMRDGVEALSDPPSLHEKA